MARKALDRRHQAGSEQNELKIPDFLGGAELQGTAAQVTHNDECWKDDDGPLQAVEQSLPQGRAVIDAVDVLRGRHIRARAP